MFLSHLFIGTAVVGSKVCALGWILCRGIPFILPCLIADCARSAMVASATSFVVDLFMETKHSSTAKRRYRTLSFRNDALGLGVGVEVQLYPLDVLVRLSRQRLALGCGEVLFRVVQRYVHERFAFQRSENELAVVPFKEGFHHGRRIHRH